MVQSQAATCVHTTQGCPSPSVFSPPCQPRATPQTRSCTNKSTRHRHRSHVCSAQSVQQAKYSITRHPTVPHRPRQPPTHRTSPLWRASLLATMALVACTAGMRGGLLVGRSAAPTATPDTAPATRGIALDTFRCVWCAHVVFGVHTLYAVCVVRE